MGGLDPPAAKDRGSGGTSSLGAELTWVELTAASLYAPLWLRFACTPSGKAKKCTLHCTYIWFILFVYKRVGMQANP